MKLNSEQEMLDFGAQFARKILDTEILDAETLNAAPSNSAARALSFELIGDVGTGKTTFTRGLAQGLGLEQPVTSPSFTISKTYALPNQKSLVHYDFYRLPDPGLMADDLAESLENPANIVVVEWGGSVKDLLPASRYTLEFRYCDDGAHAVEILNEPSSNERRS